LPISGSVFLTHGEPGSLSGLEARLLRGGFSPDQITIAEMDASYELQPKRRGAQASAPSPRISTDALSHLDWHNQRAAFLSALRWKLESASDDKVRERTLKTLQDVLARD
jgi:metallo-beta-lactamase family protein